MKYLVLFILLVLFWLLLTFDLSAENLIIGAVAALVATLFFGKYFVTGVKKLFHPARYFWLLVYVFIFIWECLKANFDVAYRVLHPAMPIKPVPNKSIDAGSGTTLKLMLPSCREYTVNNSLAPPRCVWIIPAACVF